MAMVNSDADEVFDVVDAADCVIGQATRGEIHARGLPHRAVHVLLFNSAGELYIQQRSATKDRHPLTLDSSASGHVAAGEGYDAAARRELAEELGLVVDPASLRRVARLAAGPETDMEHVWVYTVTGDYRPVPDPVELAGGAFWTLPDLARALRETPARFTPCFHLVLAASGSPTVKQGAGTSDDDGAAGPSARTRDQ
jgi:isopentenyldiphosphate isomerase